MRSLGWATKLCVVTAVLAASLPCRADAPTREYLVKAAFIYNFTQFIRWPDGAFESKDGPLIIATIGSDPFSGALDEAVAGKSAGDHAIQVHHFASVDDIGACQLLFVPASQDSSLKAIFTKINGAAVVTVGESDNFMPAGGGIRLFLEDNKMRFEIDPDPIDAAGIQISAKLMKLARIYKKSS